MINSALRDRMHRLYTTNCVQTKRMKRCGLNFAVSKQPASEFF